MNLDRLIFNKDVRTLDVCQQGWGDITGCPENACSHIRKNNPN
jgi:hypothetical protein